jgi:hypothetical protein
MGTNVLDFDPLQVKSGQKVDAGPLMGALSSESIRLTCLGFSNGKVLFDAFYYHVFIGCLEYSVEGGWLWRF